MTRDETAALLKMRSALTSQPYGDDAITAWQAVFTDRTYTEMRTALVEAAKGAAKVTVAHVIAELPARTVPDELPVDCEMCGGDGMVTVWETHGGSSYSAVVACRCAAGERVAPALTRVVEANNREHDRLAPKRDRTYVRLPGPPEDGTPHLEPFGRA